MARTKFAARYTPTPQEKIQARQIQRAQTSPWPRERLPVPDTTAQAGCDQCSARFVAIGARTATANLAEHLNAKHGDPPRRGRKAKAAP
jgi:hypothetical protein